MFRPRQIRLTITKYGFLQGYKFTASLVSVTKKSLSTVKYPFLYYLKLLKQPTYKFLGTSSNNASLKNVLCSRRILIIPALKVLVLSNTRKARSFGSFDHVKIEHRFLNIADVVLFSVTWTDIVVFDWYWSASLSRELFWHHWIVQSGRLICQYCRVCSNIWIIFP